ncbi:DUF6111 family protein [Methylocapsa sp. S129]|uniref:DUF6111 family protein n=1 Tax=Methylocapsa sp. S129 TaxID=1641869 RepID=UPI00131E915C|nr:DUF6111 family protein [Methylocapsa sp. S129]
MLRAILEPVALFLTPFIAFAIYLILRARYPLAVEHWSRGRVSTMTLAGLFIVVLGMFLLGLTAPRGRGIYVPAHVENGQLVPGHIE